MKIACRGQGARSRVTADMPSTGWIHLLTKTPQKLELACMADQYHTRCHKRLDAIYRVAQNRNDEYRLCDVPYMSESGAWTEREREVIRSGDVNGAEHWAVILPLTCSVYNTLRMNVTRFWRCTAATHPSCRCIRPTHTPIYRYQPSCCCDFQAPQLYRHFGTIQYRILRVYSRLSRLLPIGTTTSVDAFAIQRCFRLIKVLCQSSKSTLPRLVSRTHTLPHTYSI